jgi:hypothetical protein
MVVTFIYRRVYSIDMNNKTEETINTLQSKYKWMKISKTEKGYMIEDTRFKPYSVMNHGLSESELLAELKTYE